MHRNQPSDSEIRELARRQLADYERCQPGTLFAEEWTLNVADAYRLQAAVAQMRVQRSERTIGYKVGCTSDTIRQQLGIDHSISGRLYDSECHVTASVLPRRRFANLAIEGELAVELSRTPIPSDFETGNFETGDFESGDFETVGIPKCVSRIFPVIELHNHVIRGDVPSAAELIANNAIHAGFVCGDGLNREQVGHAQEGFCLKIFADDTLVDSCQGIQLLQTIHSSLQWLMTHLKQSAEQLEAGQILLTGSIPKLIPVHENCRIKVVTHPFGDVDIKFVD